jgi:hypothetical protein
MVGSDQERADIINDALGANAALKVSWSSNNWVKLRESQDWVYAYPDPEDRSVASQTDGDHILLFPQDGEQLCPRAWMEAAWPFVEHFRSNISFYPQAGFSYRRVTFIGHPDVQPSFGPDVEEALSASSWRTVERIPCRNADELHEELATRIKENVRFPKPDQLSKSV